MAQTLKAAPEGKVAPAPVPAPEKKSREQAVSDQEMVAVLSLLLM